MDSLKVRRSPLLSFSSSIQTHLFSFPLSQMDRLSSLPNELLDDIFYLAQTRKQPLTGPLSKRLLPLFLSRHPSFELRTTRSTLQNVASST